jgi:hypothetical protein
MNLLGIIFKKRTERVIREIDLAISAEEELLSMIGSKRKGIPALVEEELEKHEEYKLLSDEKKWKIKAQMYLLGKYGELKEEMGELKQSKEALEIQYL